MSVVILSFEMVKKTGELDEEIGLKIKNAKHTKYGYTIVR